MKKHKYKILVLSDLNESTSKTLKSAISLAKIVHADIDFLYVKKPTEVVNQESQLSAIGNINKEYSSTTKKVRSLIRSYSEKYEVNIVDKFTIGNVKDEIGKYLDENKPDIIVIGKRKSKVVNLLGDNLTEFILKKHNATIMIVDEKRVLEPNEELTLGLFNDTKPINTISESILNATQKPLTAFKIGRSKNTSEMQNQKTQEFVFENNGDVLKNISKYLSIKNIDLLFVDREKSIDKATGSNLKNVINTMDCSLILTT